MKTNISKLICAGLLFCSVGISVIQADTVVVFSVDMSSNVVEGVFVPSTDTVSVQGTFNNWGPGVNLVQDASRLPEHIYTNTVDDTFDSNPGVLLYRYAVGNALYNSASLEQVCDSSSGGNRGVYLPATSGSRLVLPTPFFADSGTWLSYTNTITFQVDMSEQTNLAIFNPSSDKVACNVIYWGSVFLVLDPSQPGLVYTNTIIGLSASTNAHMAYQFLIVRTNYAQVSEQLGQGDINNDGGGYRFFTMLSSNQILPVVLFSDVPLGTGITTFSVDMTVVQLTDTNFNPSSVTLNGEMTGWGGVSCTNNPSAANTNIYSCTQNFGLSTGTSWQYQYRYTWKYSPNGGIIYDHANGYADPSSQANHVYMAANSNANGTNVFVSFNDAPSDGTNDCLNQLVPVRFSVDMKNAIDIQGYAFSPFSDTVYINGTFSGWYAWSSIGIPGSDPAVYQMIESNNSSIYTNTIMIPAGQSSGISYKYTINGIDDEAGFKTNHFRVARSSAMGVYNMPTDIFRDQYKEPYFSSNSPVGGELTIGASTGSSVPVTWLGRPHVHLQVKSDLASGVWQDIGATDGTNWTTGFNSADGFVSATNYPTDSGAAYFRLVKP